MLKADAQIEGRNVFLLLGSLAGIGIAVLLLRDPRVGGAEAVRLLGAIAIAVAVIVSEAREWAAVPVTVGALGFVIVALITDEVGGLAFLMPAGLLGMSVLAATSGRWRVNVIGWLAVIGLLISAADFVGLGLVVAPFFVPIILWSFGRSSRIARERRATSRIDGHQT